MDSKMPGNSDSHLGRLIGKPGTYEVKSLDDKGMYEVEIWEDDTWFIHEGRLYLVDSLFVVEKVYNKDVWVSCELLADEITKGE